MAIVKVSNEKTVTEFSYTINPSNLEKRQMDYSVNENGLITQQLTIVSYPGTQKISFPIDFPNTCNSVFIKDGIDPEIKRNIGFCNITKSSFEMVTRPNKYESIGIKIYATGY